MNIMITTVFHRLDTSDTDWQVAHLFEHLFVTGFYKFLDGHSISLTLFGWMSAETFEDCIYIDAGFYDPRVGALMEKYISQQHTFSSGDITCALSQMQSEEKVLLSITDHQLLSNELKKLSKRLWDTSLRTKSPGAQAIAVKRSAKDFKDVIVTVHADNLTPEEQKVFLRFHVVVIDVISEALVTKKGAYSHGNSPVALRDDSMAYMSKFTMRQDDQAMSLASLRDYIQAALEDIKIDTNMQTLERHFTVFAKEALWQSMPLEYYRSTGIITTNQEVASLATAERLASILTKLRVMTRRATSADDHHIM